jgi:hypothetical protein
MVAGDCGLEESWRGPREEFSTREEQTKVLELIDPLHRQVVDLQRRQLKGSVGATRHTKRHGLGLPHIDRKTIPAGQAGQTVELALEAGAGQGQQNQIISIQQGGNSVIAGQGGEVQGNQISLGEEVPKQGLDEHAKQDGGQRAPLLDAHASGDGCGQACREFNLKRDRRIVRLEGNDKRLGDAQITEETPENGTLDSVEGLAEVDEGCKPGRPPLPGGDR